MTKLTTLLRVSFEPVAGASFVLFWIMAEVGRFDPGAVVMAVLPFLMIGIAIATARVAPGVALGVTGAVLAAQLIVPELRFDQSAFPALLGLALVAVVLGAGRNGRVRVAGPIVLSLCGVAAGLLYTVPALSPDGAFSLVTGWGPGHPDLGSNIAGWCVGFALASIGCWFVGLGIRARDERNRSEAQRLAVEADLAGAETELRLASERDRIAQDVHDIMAHSLSVIVAQADGARYLGESRPGSTNDSLAAIAASARESLVEVRMLIESLDPAMDGHSHPTLGDLEGLVARMRSAGLPVAHTVFGEAGSLTAGQQLAVYRIVQEGLTNALKHGGTSANAHVMFDWRGPGLSLTISSHGAGDAPTQPSSGRGLRGMHERARLAGGWLAAGGDDDDPHRFVVTGFVPRADALLGAPAPLSGVAS